MNRMNCDEESDVSSEIVTSRKNILESLAKSRRKKKKKRNKIYVSMNVLQNITLVRNTRHTNKLFCIVILWKIASFNLILLKNGNREKKNNRYKC